MSEKAKLSREQADAIEHLRNQGSSNRVIMRIHLENNGPNGPEPKGHHQKELQEVDTELLMQALVNDYEVEQTPEDKVREQYASPRHFHNKDNDTPADIYRKGITFVLDALNIKIDGVNT